MRRISKFSVLCLAAGVVSACALPDEIVPTTAIPTAGVRFINAVPDTGMMDFGFVDKVENSRHWQIAFRNSPIIAPTGVNGVPASSTVQYKPAEAGSRRFVIFMDGTTAAVASDSVAGNTVTLDAGKNYTVLLWGCANPTRVGAACGPLTLSFFEETVAAPAAGKTAIRIINAQTAAAATIDANFYRDSSTLVVPATANAAWTNLAASTANQTWVAADTGTIWIKVTAGAGWAAGAGVNLGNSPRRALIGAPEVLVAPGPFDATPGTKVPGSAVTGIIFPASIAATGAPQGAGSTTVPPWTAPAISFIWDRRPPRSPGV